MNEDNEAKIVESGPCPHCGYIPLHESHGKIRCDGCSAEWDAEASEPQGEEE